MKSNKWTVLLTLPVLVFFLSHCGQSDTPPPPKVTETVTVTELDSRANECLSGVYFGQADLRYDGSPTDQKVNVSIAFSGLNALVQVNGEDGDVLCTHYVGVKTKEDKGVVVLSASEVTSSRTEGNGTAYFVTNASENIPRSFGNIALTFPQNTATATLEQPSAQNPQENVQQDGQNKCSFKIASLQNLDSTPEADTIDSANLVKNADVSQADYNKLLEECGSLDAFTIKLAQEEQQAEDGSAESNSSPAEPVVLNGQEQA